MTIVENINLYSDGRETRTIWRKGENGFRSVKYSVDTEYTEIVTEFPHVTVKGDSFEVTSEMTSEAGVFIIPVTIDGAQYSFTLIIEEGTE